MKQSCGILCFSGISNLILPRLLQDSADQSRTNLTDSTNRSEIPSYLKEKLKESRSLQLIFKCLFSTLRMIYSAQNKFLFSLFSQSLAYWIACDHAFTKQDNDDQFKPHPHHRGCYGLRTSLKSSVAWFHTQVRILA